MPTSEQKRILRAGPLLRPDGALAAVGWSPQPLLDCNLEAARFYRLAALQPLRVKRWDYYAVTTPTHFFSFTLSHLGYIGMVFAYVIDFAAQTVQEETLTLPLGGGVSLPRNSTKGDATFKNRQAELSFEIRPRGRALRVNWPGFHKGAGLSAEIHLTQPPEHESMNLVIPIPGQRFYFNRKINCLPANGWVETGGKRHELWSDTCLGNLDWGRGVWAYQSFWVWASASGFLPGGRRVGLNLGYGFGDTSAATENALILNGKLHKLGAVDFDYDPGNFMRPWTMKSPDGRLDLTFTPFLERVAKTDLKLLRSEVHQMFGTYAGCAVTDQGQEVQIEGLTGWAEEHQARW
jgi:hypothetical protein